MTQKYRAPYIVLLIVTTVTFAFADLFPAREGNWWRFSFTIDNSVAGSSKFDSGTVQWRVTQNLPGYDTYWI